MTYTVPPFPKRLEIELVSDCNLKCTYCPRHYLDSLKGYMDFGLFKKIVDEMSIYSETIIVLHRRGESLLHPDFKEMLNYMSGKFKVVQLATNATLLTEDKFGAIVGSLTFISFSLDAPEVYNLTRIPAKYHAVEKKIFKFLDYNRGRVKTQVSMVKTEQTPEKDIQIFKEIWQGKVNRVRVYDEHSKNGVFGSLANPRRERKTCVKPFSEMLIYEDGSVGRCNHDWNGDPMGNVNNNSIKEIWFNQIYKNLRDEQDKLEFTDSVCKNCDSWYPEIGIQGTGEVIEK